jgi:putative DNA methylase
LTVAGHVHDLDAGTEWQDALRTVWGCLQHTIRTLKAEDGGAEAAGRLIAHMGPKASEARLLAERLYQIASQKGWNQEALVYIELAQEWPRLEELAQIQTRARESIEAAQPTLL